MFFRFFRPWEDGGRGNTHQTPHRRHGAYSEASTTTLNPQSTMPPLVLSVHTEQCGVPSEEATRSAKVLPDTAGNLLQEGDAHSIERRGIWNASQLAAPSMKNPQVCQVTALTETSASDSGENATNKDKDLDCTDTDASNSRHSCKRVWKSSCQKPETHKTCSSITSSHLTPMAPLQNDFKEVISPDMTLIFGKNAHSTKSLAHSSSLVAENNFNTALGMNADFSKDMLKINCSKFVEYSFKRKQEGQNPSPSLTEECCAETFPYASRAGGQENHHQVESKPFQCSPCRESFSRSSSNHLHERTHTGSRIFECAVCKKTFSCLYSFKRHKHIHTGSKPFKCSVCEKAFRKSSNLHEHEQIHTGFKPFKCSFCQKAFRKTYHLHEHEQIHTGSKPFKCSFCQKAFRKSYHLCIHERIHTGSKPFKCSFCQKAFRKSGDLHVHEQIHTGSKPFKCSFCHKAFRKSGDLHVHERIHTGSRPFKCTTCEKAFTQLGNLHKHERIHK